MSISSTIQQIMRTHPQTVELCLSVFQPQTIWKARVNTVTTAKGLLVIPYTDISLGYTSSIETDFIVLIGTYNGGEDVGRLRIRTVSGGALHVEEHSLTIVTGQYLTVLKYVEPRPINPRMTQGTGTSAEEVSWYKDYNIPYTNQNEMLGAFVCAGPHRAANLVSGTATLYWSSEGSESLVGASMTYNWTFEGGSPASGTSATPGNVYYDTPGHYVTKLAISSSSGTQDVGYRYTSIYHEPGQGTSAPVLKWKVNQVTTGLDEGGLVMSLQVSEPVVVKEGYAVVIYGKSLYDGVKYNIGGNAAVADNIYLTGYVLDGSVQYDWEFGTVEFKVGSITEVMKNKEPFGSVSLEAKQNPSFWYEFKNTLMKGETVMYHFLKWHSTVLKLNDFVWSCRDARIQYFDTTKTNVYDAASKFVSSAYTGVFACDRQGRIYVDNQGRTIGIPSNYPPEMVIDKADWVGTPTIQRNLSKPTSWTEMGGVSFNGGSTSTPLMSAAPSLLPDPIGKPQRVQGLAVQNQTELNKLVGAIWSNDNYEYPVIDMDMAGPYWEIDILPLRAYQMNIQPGDTPQNVAITGTYYPASISYTFDADDETFAAHVTWKALTVGVIGETIVIPKPPNPVNVDPPEVPGTVVITEPTTTYPIMLWIRDSLRGVFCLNSEEIEGGSYSWVEVTGRLTPAEVSTLSSTSFQLFGGGYNVSVVGDTGYYYGDAFSGVSLVVDADWFTEKLVSANVPKQINTHVNLESGVVYGATYYNVGYGDRLGNRVKVWYSEAGGEPMIPAQDFPLIPALGLFTISIGTSGVIHVEGSEDFYGFVSASGKSDDGGDTYTSLGGSLVALFGGASLTRGGYQNKNVLLWGNNGSGYPLYLSQDDGYTATNISSSLPVGGYVIVDGLNRVAFSTGSGILAVMRNSFFTKLYYSPDNGSSWTDVSSAFPLIDLSSPTLVAWFGNSSGVGGWIVLGNTGVATPGIPHVFLSLDLVTSTDITGNLHTLLVEKEVASPAEITFAEIGVVLE